MVTVKVPDLNNAGLTDEAKQILVLFLQALKDQFNDELEELKARVTTLE